MSDAHQKSTNLNSKNLYFRVCYSKLGQVLFDEFEDLETAIKDYEAKLDADRQGHFDDRFVIGIEDKSGNAVYPNLENGHKIEATI
jgi:hypothetical protein